MRGGLRNVDDSAEQEDARSIERGEEAKRVGFEDSCS
jgi:hypothetical protein